MDFLTTNDVAKILKKDRHYVGMLRQAGLLDFYRFGRGYMHTEEQIKKFLSIAENYDLSTKEKVILAGMHEREKGKKHDR